MTIYPNVYDAGYVYLTRVRFTEMLRNVFNTIVWIATAKYCWHYSPFTNKATQFPR